MQNVQNGITKSHLVYKWWKIYGEIRLFNELKVLFLIVVCINKKIEV